MSRSVWLSDVVIVQISLYVTPSVPAVIGWVTVWPEIVAEPLTIALGDASVPE